MLEAAGFRAGCGLKQTVCSKLGGTIPVISIEGREVIIGVRHGEQLMSWEYDDTMEGACVSLRCTDVWVKEKVSGVKIAEANAVCSITDNFCKKVGRRIAASRLIAKLKAMGCQWLSKANRKAIFQSICPEYGGQE